MRTINQPFRLTLEHYGEKAIVEKPHSDVTMEELYDMFKSLALAAGFSSDLVNEYFKEE